MTIKVTVVGLLKNYTEGRSSFEFLVGLSVSEIIKDLKIPNELVAGVFINNRAEPKDYSPSDGDTVKLIAVIGGGWQEEYPPVSFEATRNFEQFGLLC
jgi:sulfur carrier protein ThiS